MLTPPHCCCLTPGVYPLPVPIITVSCTRKLQAPPDDCAVLLCPVGLSGPAGKLSRDVAISQTAAAMVAWFQQQLSGSSGSDKAAVTTSAGSSAGVQGAASAAHMPIASAGLNAAGMAVAAAPAPSATAAAEAATEQEKDDADGAAQLTRGFGRDVQASFKQWVTSPLVAEDIDFTIKQGSGSA